MPAIFTLDFEPIQHRVQHAMPEVVRIERLACGIAEDEVSMERRLGYVKGAAMPHFIYGDKSMRPIPRRPIFPYILQAEDEGNQRRDAEEVAIRNADTSHLDGRFYKVHIDRKIRETEKAYLLRVGHWRSHRTQEAWIPKSQISFHSDREAFIPVWLAKKLDYRITIESHTYERAVCAQCGSLIIRYGSTPPSLCVDCR